MLNPDGVLGRALMTPAGATFTVPLRLANDVSFSTRAMLLPHDWRDGRGAVRAAVAITQSDGSLRELWSGVLRASDWARPRGRQINRTLPACTTALQLSVQAKGPRLPRTVDRAIWVQPTITDPHAPPPPAAPAARTPPTHPPIAAAGPVISVLMPVHDPPPHMLEEAIGSVQAQTYANWELCLVDDGSTNPQITAALQRHAATDPRINLQRHEHATGISTATNTALALATGTYIALLDHDDTLTPDALEHVANQVTANPDLDMIYSDEDVVLDGRPIWQHLKPDWSPDTLRTNGYTCHLGVYRRELVKQIGGFRSAFNGSQDVDMILRLVERTDRIAHIPRILYHWRAHESSTAGGDSKPYAYVAARQAIAAHLQRSGLEAEVGYGPPGLYRVAHRIDPSTSVDLVLAIDDPRGLEQAAKSWLDQSHANWNLVLAAPASTLPAAAEALGAAGIDQSRITMVSTDPGQSIGGGLAAAADAATSEHVLLMQTPAVGLTHDWLTRLIGYSQQPDIAAAGPVLLSPDGRVQQAGIAIPDGIPLYLLHGGRSTMDKFFGYGTSVFNVAAVSGMLASTRETYQRLGGLSPARGDLALIDYCLRGADSHERVVVVPDARMRITGTDLAANDLAALWRLRHDWAQTHTRDPYYNPCLRTDHGDFAPISV